MRSPKYRFSPFGLLLVIVPVSAHAGCHIVTRGFKSYLACSGDIAKAAGQVTQVAQQAIGQPITAGVKHFGRETDNQLRKAGVAINRQAIQSGHDFNKGAINVGKTLEKAGQDIGSFLKWATNFTLSCDLKPPPDNLRAGYEGCSIPLARYKQDYNVCLNLGGASVVAASVAANAAAGVATFGVSLAAAKTAFEYCEQACRRQKAFEDCIAATDATAASGAAAVADERRRNEGKLAHVKEFECAYEALANETEWKVIALIKECENDPHKNCDPQSDAFAADYKKKSDAIMQNIKIRRDALDAAADNGTALPDDCYGLHKKSPRLVDGALASAIRHKRPSKRVCFTTRSKIIFWTKVSGSPGERVRHRWLYGDVNAGEVPLMFTSEHRLRGNNYRVWSSKTVAGNPGMWSVALVSKDDEILGLYKFIAIPPR